MISQTSKVHSSTPGTNESELDYSKIFLCKGIDGSDPAARNLGTLVRIDQSVLIIKSGKFLVWSNTEASSYLVGQ